MRVICDAIRDGWFGDEYGCKGSADHNGMPGISPGFRIEDAPEGTRSFAVILDDYDAVSAAGFLWVHWLICDLKSAEVAEGATRTGAGFTEGSNSWFSVLGGPSGFRLNDLMFAMDGHVLAHCKTVGKYTGE